MGVRGAGMTLLMVTGLACGGRAVSGEAAGEGGSAAAPGDGTSAGKAASGGAGNCNCLQLGCDDGFMLETGPNDCCGKCVLNCQDVACPTVDLQCEPGMHVGNLPDECCALCVPDDPFPCDLGQKMYEMFRSETLAKYQSLGCMDESDCAVFSEYNRCSQTCGGAVPTGARASTQVELEGFAQRYCSQCRRPVAPLCTSALPLSCIDSVCRQVPNKAK